MLIYDIPGMGKRQLDHLVLDYNGTLAVDGILLSGVAESLKALAADLNIQVLTADTFGKAAQGLSGLPCELAVLPPGAHVLAIRVFIRNLGADTCACVG
ncbi:MAG: hypothetical protein P8010_06010 [Desulfosarcinaceae bacterium]